MIRPPRAKEYGLPVSDDYKIRNAEYSVNDATRYQVSNGVQQKVMAEKYNMSKAQVSRIVTGKRWAHVKGN